MVIVIVIIIIIAVVVVIVIVVVVVVVIVVYAIGFLAHAEQRASSAEAPRFPRANYIYIYIYIYIYKHPADSHFPPIFPLGFPSQCAGGAHCLARGLIRAGGHTTGSTWSGPLEISGGRVQVQLLGLCYSGRPTMRNRARM